MQRRDDHRHALHHPEEVAQTTVRDNDLRKEEGLT